MADVPEDIDHPVRLAMKKTPIDFQIKYGALEDAFVKLKNEFEDGSLKDIDFMFFASSLADFGHFAALHVSSLTTPPTQVEKVKVKDAKKWAEQQKRWFDDEGDAGSVLCLETILEALALLGEEE